MARSIAQIQQQIINEKNADTTLSALTSTSKVAIWRLWTFVIATCMWVLENLFDAHKQEVTDIIAKQKAHRLQWYAEVIKRFQIGYSLPAESEVYAVIDTAAMIVKQAAMQEITPTNTERGYLRAKVAKESAGVLAPLDNTEKAALKAYISRWKDAGVDVRVTSANPDNLKLALIVYYDALVLSADGSRLDGSAATPVKDAINTFLSSLPFNGVFVRNRMISYTEEVPGVRIATPTLMQANYGITSYVDIPTEYRPDAGYMKLDEDYFNTHITYIPHEPI